MATEEDEGGGRKEAKVLRITEDLWERLIDHGCRYLRWEKKQDRNLVGEEEECL